MQMITQPCPHSDLHAVLVHLVIQALVAKVMITLDTFSAAKGASVLLFKTTFLHIALTVVLYMCDRLLKCPLTRQCFFCRILLKEKTF